MNNGPPDLEFEPPMRFVRTCYNRTGNGARDAWRLQYWHNGEWVDVPRIEFDEDGVERWRTVPGGEG